MSLMRFLIYCPVGVKTGGPECLYQLSDALNSLGYKSLIVPTTDTANSEPCDDFEIYKVSYLKNQEIMPNDVLIIPEVITRIPNWIAREIQPSNIVIWWLSIDNSPINPFKSFELHNYGIHPSWEMQVTKVKELMSYRIKSTPIKTLFLIRKFALKIVHRFSTTGVSLQSSKHYAQSDYAKTIVSTKLGVRVGKLSDYVFGSENKDVPKPKENRLKKRIAINPFKGAELMITFREFIKDDVNFFELKNLDTEGIAQALSQSDLYLDLGHFPGKDRIPREAILEGCPVFLAKRGAARNEIDFSLPSKFKVDLQTTTPNELREIVLSLLADNSLFDSQLDFFYEQVNSKRVFFAEVLQLGNLFCPTTLK